MPPKREAAQISLAYNIGGTRYCSGRIPTLLNAGKTIEACDAFLLYTKAKGIEIPGLVRRRNEERTMCLEGLT